MEHHLSQPVALSLPLPMSSRELFDTLTAHTRREAEHYAPAFAPPLRVVRPTPPTPLRVVTSATEWQQGTIYHASESFWTVQRDIRDLHAQGYETRLVPGAHYYIRLEYRRRQPAPDLAQLDAFRDSQGDDAESWGAI
jgi:hypothetical protein